jgi:hypothetical protein
MVTVSVGRRRSWNGCLGFLALRWFDSGRGHSGWLDDLL